MFDTARESDTACFRALETHEYWNSAELADADDDEYDAQESTTFGD
jgi:hypothetical protein